MGNNYSMRRTVRATRYVLERLREYGINTDHIEDGATLFFSEDNDGTLYVGRSSRGGGQEVPYKLAEELGLDTRRRDRRRRRR